MQFHKEYDRLTVEPRDLVDLIVQDLTKNPKPPGLSCDLLAARYGSAGAGGRKGPPVALTRHLRRI